MGILIILHLEVGWSADATRVWHADPPQRRDLRVVRGRRWGGRDGRRPDGGRSRAHRRPSVDLKKRRTFIEIVHRQRNADLLIN